MSTVIDMIRSRGYWDVAIRPEQFEAQRIPYEDLEKTLTNAVVRLRGWPVPYIGHRDELRRADDWIGQDIDARTVEELEAWRFFTSGQFTHLRAVWSDWAADQRRLPEGPTSVIAVWEILFYVTEVFELAARLALTPAGDDVMTVDIGLHGLADRGLVVGQRNRAPFFQPYHSQVPSLERSVTLARAELLSDPRGHAARVARDMFLRFGWTPSLEQLSEHQRELDRP